MVNHIRWAPPPSVVTHPIVNHMLYPRLMNKWHLLFSSQVVVLSVVQQHVGGKLVPVNEPIC